MDHFSHPWWLNRIFLHNRKTVIVKNAFLWRVCRHCERFLATSLPPLMRSFGLQRRISRLPQIQERGRFSGHVVVWAITDGVLLGTRDYRDWDLRPGQNTIVHRDLRATTHIEASGITLLCLARFGQICLKLNFLSLYGLENVLLRADGFLEDLRVFLLIKDRLVCTSGGEVLFSKARPTRDNLGTLNLMLITFMLRHFYLASGTRHRKRVKGTRSTFRHLLILYVLEGQWMRHVVKALLVGFADRFGLKTAVSKFIARR